MSMEKRIRDAVTPIVPECVAIAYTGSEPVYCIYNMTEVPDGFGDNRARAIRYLVQLHLFLPFRQDPSPLKIGLRRAIVGARFTTPAITNASDGEGQHYVFEFEGVDGEV